MRTKLFQAELVAKLRVVAGRASAKVEHLRRVSIEALRLCVLHPDLVPDQAVAAFERKYAGLWKSPEKRDILPRS